MSKKGRGKKGSRKKSAKKSPLSLMGLFGGLMGLAFSLPVEVFGAICGTGGAVAAGMLGLHKLNQRDRRESRSASFFYDPPPANRPHGSKPITKGPLIERKGRGAVNTNWW